MITRRTRALVFPRGVGNPHRPLTPAGWHVRHIIRRMRHHGGGSMPAAYRARGPTFRGCIGIVLERMAARRKAHR